MTNLTEQQGDSFSKEINFENEDGTTPDITNWTIYVTVKENYDQSDANAVLSQDVSNHTDPTNGKTEFSFDNDAMEALDGRYVYEIKYQDGGGLVETVLRGLLTVEPAVRKDIT